MSTLGADHRRDLQRWLICGAIVLFAHGGLAAAIGQWKDPIVPGDPSGAIVLQLAPVEAAPDTQLTDVAPGPEQVQAEATPEQQVEKVEEKVEEKIEPAPNPEVVIEQPKPEPPKPKETRPPAPATTAPPRAPKTRVAAVPTAPVEAPPNDRNSNALADWKTRVVGLLERNKRYPSAANGEKGVAQVEFRITRQGNVVSTRIVKSSGSAPLDQETLDLVRRVQPFPPPPPEMPGATVGLMLPMNFR
jgi:protein TonB